VWRCCGGIEDRGSEEARCGAARGAGDGEAAFTVEAVVFRGKVGRAAVSGVS
jgi:hypothetical protein